VEWDYIQQYNITRPWAIPADVGSWVFEWIDDNSIIGLCSICKILLSRDLAKSAIESPSKLLTGLEYAINNCFVHVLFRRGYDVISLLNYLFK